MEAQSDSHDISDFEVIDFPSFSEYSEGVKTPPVSENDAFNRLPDLRISSIEDGHPPWQGHRDKLVGLVDMGR